MHTVLRRKLTSAALIIGLFVLWEFLCAAFGVSDVVLPRPSQIIATLVARFPALWPHTLQTLYTTLVGFALGVAIGVLIGIGIGRSKLAHDGPSAAGRIRPSRWLSFRSSPLFRRRHRAVGAHRHGMHSIFPVVERATGSGHHRA
jgi:ABC-type phosphate/phosphonate transport system permease subunit